MLKEVHVVTKARSITVLLLLLLLSLLLLLLLVQLVPLLLSCRDSCDVYCSSDMLLLLLLQLILRISPTLPSVE